MKNIMNFLREMLKRTTPQQAVLFELAEAEHALLRAETGVEYAQALVTYNKQRVKRLRAYITPAEEKSA